MKVYRVQNNHGYGPYYGDRAGFQTVMQAVGRLHDFNRHPIEGSVDDFPLVRWGFSSMRHLREWFDPFGEDGYRYMRDNGYAVHVFNVPSDGVRKYRRQVTFDYSRATLERVKELPQ